MIHSKPAVVLRAVSPAIGAEQSLVSMVVDQNSPKELRSTIDRVATLRAKMIRIGLFGTLLYRPDPAGPPTAETHAQYLAILTEEVEHVRDVGAMLARGAAINGVSTIVCRWIARIAANHSSPLAKILDMVRLSEEVLAAAKAGGPEQREMLAKHMKTARSGFFEATTDLCDALWDDLSAAQKTELEQANSAAAALAEKLTRLERIGKHVRLVSLNASVEASRAGDVGKGLMVIAAEFKTLAEEIQNLAREAHAEMDASPQKAS